jgi:hypothetical protein
MSHLDPLELDAARAGAEYAHAELCDECGSAVADLRSFAERLASATRIDVPASVDAAILARVPRRRPLWRIWVAAAAVLLVAVGVGTVRFHPRTPDVVDAYRVSLKGGDGAALARACVRTPFLAIVLGAQDETRFTAIDVFIDGGAEAVAAWQVEVKGNAQIVGIEGGEGVWKEPAQYDPDALSGGRLVLAAFTGAKEPPAGRVRVARLHVVSAGAPEVTVKLVAAALPGGARFVPKVETGGTK